MASVDAARLAARSDAAMTTPLFFPSSSPTASLLATLAVFAIAFVARPIGSILLGRVGDQYGRKPALAIAVLHMALATFAMGLSPTHAAIGATAPTLLVAARLLQGLSASGEVSGAPRLWRKQHPGAERHRPSVAFPLRKGGSALQ